MTLPPFPIDRERALDPPDALRDIRKQGPMCPVRLPDQTAGWLVTGLREAQEVLADDEWFSARQELRRLPHGIAAPPAAAPGFFVRVDGSEHQRYRRRITAHFTRRRLRSLQPFVEQTTDACLDALEEAGPPVDAIATLAVPIPGLVIGEILGIDHSRRHEFQQYSRLAVDMSAAPSEVSEALGQLNRLIAEEVSQRTPNPDGDVISTLLAAGDLSHEEVVSMAFLLLVAGHETTSAMIGLGLYLLLTQSDPQGALQALALDEDPLAPGTPAARLVDEVLRHQSVNQFGAMRVATRDGEFAGCPVRAGDTVVVHLPAANRDPRAHAAPDEFRPDRADQVHVTFGHGPHHCSGAMLARLELRVVWGRLARRFPHLHLAVPAADIRTRPHHSVYGVEELPLSW